MTTVRSDNAAVPCLGMLLNDVTEFSDQSSWLYGLDSFVQALSCRLNDSHSIGVRLGLVTNIVRLIQIGMVTSVVKRNVDVENIAVEKDTLIGNTVTDDLIDRGTARFREAVVVQGRRIRLPSLVLRIKDARSTYLAVNTGLVDNLVDVIGRHTRFGCRSSNVEDLASKFADLAHSILACLIVNLELVSVGERAAVLGVAVLPPDGVGDRLGEGSVLGERVDGSKLSTVGVVWKRVIEAGSWIW